MEISKAVVAVAAALCVAAGAGGAYLVTRGSDPEPAQVIEGSVISPDPTVGTVEQSEALVNDLPAAQEPATEAPRVESRPAPRPAPRAERAPQRPARTSAPVAPIEEKPAPLASDHHVLAPPALEPVPTVQPEPARAIEPAAPQFEELVVAADAVIGLQVETSVTSEQARVEDEVVARVTRDVRVGDRVAIPAGSKAHGEVTLVERGGRLKDRARLGIRFTSIVLADGTRVPLETETIYREGSGPGGESAAKIGGGAIGGAIIGGILGGAKGAAIGGSVGAGAGTAAVMAGGRNPATLPSGTPVTVRVVRPATVTVEK
jgi:type IV secretory pathway VirB10-like protein